MIPGTAKLIGHVTVYTLSINIYFMSKVYKQEKSFHIIFSLLTCIYFIFYRLFELVEPDKTNIDIMGEITELTEVTTFPEITEHKEETKLPEITEHTEETKMPERKRCYGAGF